MQYSKVLWGYSAANQRFEGTAVTFDSVAKLLFEHTVEWVDDLVKSFLHLEEADRDLNPALLSLKDLELLGGAALLDKDWPRVGDGALVRAVFRRWCWRGSG